MSLRDVQVFVETKAHPEAQANAKKKSSPMEVRVKMSKSPAATGLTVCSTPGSNADFLLEWEAPSGTARRAGVRVDDLRRWTAEGKITPLIFFGMKLFNVKQVLAAKNHELPHPVDMEVFKRRKFAPMLAALETLGLNYPALNKACSEACNRGEIANRKIGNLRFVSIPDVETWYAGR